MTKPEKFEGWWDSDDKGESLNAVFTTASGKGVAYGSYWIKTWAEGKEPLDDDVEVDLETIKYAYNHPEIKYDG